MQDKTQSRKWLLTINNPIEHHMTHEEIREVLGKFKSLRYWCMCDEIGLKDKTYHTHLFINGTNGIRFVAIKNKFPSAHIDFCRGTIKDNRDYIRKEGKYKGSTKEETNLPETFEESGEMPPERQGQRNDLIELYDMIKSGMSNYEILETNPGCMNYIEKIDRTRYVIKQEQFKNVFRQLETTYIFGESGIGKSRSVMEQYGYENVYRVTDYKHPFDSYSGQDVIVFEEFYSNLKINDMLNFLDGYPLDLPCRYNNKIACYTKVYIISNISLNDQYAEIQRKYEETWKAFLRRISKVQIFNGIDCRVYTMEEYRHGFVSVSDTSEDVPFETKYQQEMLEL